MWKAQETEGATEEEKREAPMETWKVPVAAIVHEDDNKNIPRLCIHPFPGHFDFPAPRAKWRGSNSKFTWISE